MYLGLILPCLCQPERYTLAGLRFYFFVAVIILTVDKTKMQPVRTTCEVSVPTTKY